MPASECLQVLEFIAKNCEPSFPIDEVKTKLESVLKRVARKEYNVSEEVLNYVSVTNGYFSVTDCYQALQSVTTNRTAVRVALHRLAEKGTIERWGEKDGVFRRVDNECEDIDFLNASTESLHIRWPFTIERYVKTLPKNIVVIAGEPDAGKTAFLLNFVKNNMHEHEIYYFSSEMGPIEFNSRLSKFDFPLTDWKFTLKERSSNFADVVKPDAINIIDFLELHDEFYKVGGLIKDIFDRLKKGIAIIALQKNPNTNYGLGGMRSIEKARLYLSMEPGKIKIVKGRIGPAPSIQTGWRLISN
jgi:Fe2+ or Zn2+ uptake regulation protein